MQLVRRTHNQTMIINTILLLGIYYNDNIEYDILLLLLCVLLKPSRNKLSSSISQRVRFTIDK